jgi:hypothetical protein
MTTPQTPAESMMAVQEAMVPIIAAVAGHRAQLEAAGFSPTAAEHMAVDFHRSLLATAFSGATR